MSSFFLSIIAAGAPGGFEGSQGGEVEGNVVDVPPFIAGFTASDLVVAPGSEVTLRWEVEGAESVSVTPGDESIPPGVSAWEAVVTDETIFTLTAKNGGGESHAQVTVYVRLFGAPRPLDPGERTVTWPKIADVDGDGLNDILYAGRNEVIWLRNDGHGSFSAPIRLPDPPITEVYLGSREVIDAADVDRDGDIDVIYGPFKNLFVYENLGGGIFRPTVLVHREGGSLDPVFATDLDGDGDLDIVATPEQLFSTDARVIWFRNLGNARFAEGAVISDLNVHTLVPADLDGDGDMDLAYLQWRPSHKDDILGWLPNEGTELFGRLRMGDPIVISANHDVPFQIRATDFDGDSDVDLLVDDLGNQQVIILLNRGDATFAEPVSISNTLIFPEGFDAGDLDGDGDLDFVTADPLEVGEISLHLNLAAGQFLDEQPLTGDYPNADSVHLGDLDGDGDLDVLAGNSGGYAPIWFENLNTPPRLRGGIEPVSAEEDHGPVEIHLSAWFEDDSHPSSTLDYRLRGFDGPSVVAGAAIVSGSLQVHLKPDGYGRATFQVTAADPRGLSVDGEVILDVLPVNDPPRASIIPAITADARASPVRFDLNEVFHDVDVGDTLRYSVEAVVNDTLFQSTLLDPETGFLDLHFAPYGDGVSDLTVKATDDADASVEAVFRVILPPVPPPKLDESARVTLNRQTGLLEHRIILTNTSERAMGGIRLSAGGLPDGVTLFNAGETDAGGTRLIVFGSPTPPGESLALTLEYYSPSRDLSIAPEYRIELIVPRDPELIESGEAPFAVSRVVSLPGGAILLEFPTEPGRVYQLQYADGGGPWTGSPVRIRAPGRRFQWIDDGPPNTGIHPRSSPMRIYRIATAKNAEGGDGATDESEQ